MKEVSLVSQGERCPSARGTEALRSCFCRPGRHSMTTGRRESSRSTCRRRGARLWRLPPPARRGHPGPREGKSRGKNRGGDITSMCLRRSLFFVAPATAADRPSRRKPGETVKARPGRPGRAGCGLTGAPMLPKAACLPTWGSGVRAGHETRITAFTHRARQASATKSWRALSRASAVSDYVKQEVGSRIDRRGSWH